MGVVNDLTDKLVKLPIAYGRHAVKGYLTKHDVQLVGTSKQVTIQRALGKGPWDSAEKRYYSGFEIEDAANHFHSGTADDAPDDFFPTDVAHPNAAYESTRLPIGMGDEDVPDNLIGIYKTRKVANYDGAGVQTGFGYSASPARTIADLRLLAKRNPAFINYPAWVDWRDYCAELINWDDGALTPHYVSLTLSVGGSLAAGTRYWVRVATLKGADISSASQDRSTTDPTVTASVIVSGANLQFTVDWASQEERLATAYRVYIGTAEGAEDRYFTVADPAVHTLLITTLAGATMGAPPEVATGALLRQIPRFESHVFFQPPFDLSMAMDRIAQITCMDWHYAKGKLVFLTPEIRDPVFTLNLAEITNFKTWQIDRRQRPNQIIVSYRDLDDPYLAQADPPVTINRLTLQAAEGTRPFEINMGCCYRSQAERCGHFWARRLIDSGQMFEGLASPKTYIVLPGDPVLLTHDVPDWENISFYIEEKEESEDTKAGYQMKGRVYGEWYSDTSHEPLPRPFPPARENPFIAPPVATDLVITVDTVFTTKFLADFNFGTFIGRQKARILIKGPVDPVGGLEPDDSTYRSLGTVEPSDSSQGHFESVPLVAGKYWIKVATESLVGVTADSGHPVGTADIRPAAISDPVIVTDAHDDTLLWCAGHPRVSEKPAVIKLEVWSSVDRTTPAGNLLGTLIAAEVSSHPALIVADQSGAGTWSGGADMPDEEA